MTKVSSIKNCAELAVTFKDGYGTGLCQRENKRPPNSPEAVASRHGVEYYLPDSQCKALGKYPEQTDLGSN